MPTIPKQSKCASLGCKNPRTNFSSFCVPHGGKDKYYYQRDKDKRKESADKYNSKQWKVFRQIQLSKHPICAGCKANGFITSAQHVDHVFPWTQIGEHAFLHNIFQSLCQSCHSSKTQLEQQGIYKHYGIKDYTQEDYRVVVANWVET